MPIQETVVADAPASATVGSSTTEVLAASPNLRLAYFTNDSDEVIYLGLGHPAVASKGIRLNAAGGNYDTNDEPFTINIPAGVAVNAICASGGKNLCIQTFSLWTNKFSS